jgi:hypothetical protein
MQRAQDEWAALIADVEAERVAGTDPADPRLDPLVERWTSHGAMRAETMTYAGKAIAARWHHPA